MTRTIFVSGIISLVCLGGGIQCFIEGRLELGTAFVIVSGILSSISVFAKEIDERLQRIEDRLEDRLPK